MKNPLFIKNEIIDLSEVVHIVFKENYHLGCHLIEMYLKNGKERNLLLDMPLEEFQEVKEKIIDLLRKNL